MKLALLFSSITLVASTHHVVARSYAVSPRAFVSAKATADISAQERAKRAAQSAAAKLSNAQKQGGKYAMDSMLMAGELVARKKLAQSAADKLQAGTLARAGSAAAAQTAQINELLVETRLAREATEKLLAVTEKAARDAALRWGIENAEVFEFNYKDCSSKEYRQGPFGYKSGWVVKQILSAFLWSPAVTFTGFYWHAARMKGLLAWKDWDHASEAASFADKVADQIHRLTGEKPLIHTERKTDKDGSIVFVITFKQQ